MKKHFIILALSLLLIGCDSTMPSYSLSLETPSSSLESDSSEEYIEPTGTFSFTINDPNDYIIDGYYRNGEYQVVPGNEIKLYTITPSNDFNLSMYVNGEFYSNGQLIDSKWTYVFEMIPEEITITFEKTRPDSDIITDSFVSFLPTKSTTLHVDEFLNQFKFSEYHHDLAVEYTEVNNYIPEEYSNKYDIDAFEVAYHKRKRFFIYNGGNIYNVTQLNNENASFNGFVHFAIADINNDGFIEFYISHHYSNTLKTTKISVLDTKTNTIISSSSIYDNYSFFKKNENNQLAIYNSKTNDITKANEKFSDVYCNTTKYQFKNKEYSLSATNYKVDIKIEEDTINFPVIFKNLKLTFKVYTSMTYLGETFSYTNSDTYLDGALVSFINGEHQVYNYGWAAGEAITYFTITTGMVIESEYMYGTSSIPEGLYDLVVSYRFDDENIIVNDALQIISLVK